MLLLVEVFIALFIKDDLIRPYLGDVLVTMLIYCFVRSFFKIGIFPALLFVLAFSFFIEFLQYLNLIEKLGLQYSKLARAVLGTSFSWLDLLCYTIGVGLTGLVELFRRKHYIKTYEKSPF